MTKKQTTDLEEVIGKTVDGFLWNRWEDKLILTFSDGTFLFLSGGFESAVDCDDNFRDHESSFDKNQLLELGIISQAEYDKEQNRLREIAEKKRLKAEEDERQLYEQLKQKFGESA